MADPIAIYGWLLTLAVAAGLAAEDQPDSRIGRAVQWLSTTFIGDCWDGLTNVFKVAIRWAAGSRG